jgi:hypothetical protein
MRAGPFALVFIIFIAGAAFAEQGMAPSDIKAAFFSGQPFTASTPGGTQFKMIFYS